MTQYLRAVVDLGERQPRGPSAGPCSSSTGRGQYKQALTVIRQLQKDGPIPVPLRRVAAELAYRDRQLRPGPRDGARQPLGPSPTDYRELLLLGRIHAAKGQPAGPLFRRAVALAPAAPEAHASLVTYLASQRELDAARNALTEAERALPKDKAALTLARGYEVIGDAERAGPLFEAALKSAPDDSTTLRAVAVHYLRTNRIEDAQSLMKRIIDLKKDPVQATWARRILALLAAAGGNPRDAILAQEILDPDGAAGPEGTEPEDLRIKAKILAQQPGRAKRLEAIEMLEGVLKRPGRDRERSLPARPVIRGGRRSGQGQGPDAHAHQPRAEGPEPPVPLRDGTC